MEKVHTVLSTGLKGLDHTLRGVRPGDNIVWQVDSVEEYIPFVHPFCREAHRNGRKLIYLRFAEHQPLIPADIQAEVFHLHPEDGFENFLDEIFTIIESFGVGACYVFDSLTELAADWYSDRMLGNFFMLTCPYLYDFDTATYFALLKNRHTSQAIDSIHNTAQVIIDVYRRKERLYIQPIKVYKRHSDSMYMLHSWNSDDDFSPVLQSTTISEVLSGAPRSWIDQRAHSFDYWSSTFSRAQELLESNRTEADSDEYTSLFNKLLRMAITREPRLMALAQNYFSMSDLIEIGKRMTGTGLIGGKSAGMLLARAILLREDQKWIERLDSHDSFYVGSDLFYTYLICNGCWWIRRRLKNRNMVIDDAQEARQRLLNGTFPEEIRTQFSEILSYFGQFPFIVRSSSLLEDAYGNAFSGKYESVFCANQGTPEQRLENFLDAVRRVYASTLSEEALSYRAHWDLIDKDEQMALLIQRVSGSFYNDLFFPQSAGVGFSYNPYVWNERIEPQAGMLRLVFGLGTRAVDRNDDDYTRVVSLSDPLLRPDSSSKDAGKYTQRKADVLDLKENRLVTLSIGEVSNRSGTGNDLDLFISRDPQAIQSSTKAGSETQFSGTLSFDRLLSETTFAQDMKKILLSLQRAYEHPVDIEFTVNFTEEQTLRINLVQCRPFQVKIDSPEIAQVDSVAEKSVIISTSGPVIGNSLASKIDRLVYVVPDTYSELSQSDRYSVARLIGKINHLHLDKEFKIMLLGPGRWGTTTPSLGVPVSFTEINTVSIICEIACMHEGLIPDISLGTHFFNDLVEMDMLYLAVYPERKGHLYNKSFLDNAHNSLVELLPESAQWSHVIKVIDSGKGVPELCVHIDPMKQKGLCYLG